MRIMTALALVLAVGCKKTDNVSGTAKEAVKEAANEAAKGPATDDGPPVLVFGKQVEDTVAARTSSAFNRPAVSKAFDDALASLGNDPKLSAQLGTLVEKLQADARVSGAIESLMNHLIDDPRVAANLQQVMADNPGATPDQIGELFGKQFEQRWATPEVNEAWMGAWDAMTKKIGSRPELDLLFRAVITKATSGLATPEVEAKVGRKIIEKNGGQRPDTAKATQIALDQMWTEERIDGLLVMLLTNPTVRSATAQFLADALADESINNTIVGQAGSLAANKAVVDKTLRALQSLYVKDLVVADVSTKLRALTTDEALTKGLGDLLGTISTSPKLSQLANTWYSTMAADPKLKADLNAFIENW
jgi:hypothetical protein